MDSTPDFGASDDLAPYERAVPRELSRYTYPERWLRYNGQCYPEAFRYTMAHRQIPGIAFVLGKCYPHGDRTGQFAPHTFDAGFWHAWVELPDLIFEATRQRFYDRVGWAQAYQPHHIKRYTPEEAYRLAEAGWLPGFGYARYLSQYRHNFPPARLELEVLRRMKHGGDPQA
jgi:hypothetical protein